MFCDMVIVFVCCVLPVADLCRHHMYEKYCVCQFYSH